MPKPSKPGRLCSQGPLSNPNALLEPMAADELASWESGALLPDRTARAAVVVV
jgi:hypothetical protein